MFCCHTHYRCQQCATTLYASNCCQNSITFNDYKYVMHLTCHAETVLCLFQSLGQSHSKETVVCAVEQLDYPLFYL